MKIYKFKIVVAFPDCNDMCTDDIYTAIKEYIDNVAVEVKEIEDKDEN